ncbi:hypothetical protein SHIRM173S_07919 [Streptomyces hirsutus]
MRELREELGVDAHPGRLPRPVAPETPVRPARVDRLAAAGSAAPAPLEDHDALRWLSPGEIWDVPWLAADVPAVHRTLTHLGVTPPAGPPGA